MMREVCAGCGADELQTFLDLGSSPLADRFPATADEAETWYPLQVAVCRSCWLVQQLCVVDDVELYGADYGFFTGSSPSAVSYFKRYAAELVDRFELNEHKLVVEVACNDGTMLEALGERGSRTVGVEPAGGPADAARERGLTVVGVPFGKVVAEGVVADYGHADLVVANNVAAHVADPHDFFAGIEKLLSPGGVAVIEVQNLADLLAGNMFDHVYHEHRFFYSVDTLAQVMSHHGLYVTGGAKRTEAQGGSIRVIATRSSTVTGEWMAPPWLSAECSYLAAWGRVEQTRDALRRLVAAERTRGRVVAGYAASAKSTTLLNFCELNTEWLDHVVDLTPGKIGRFTPGSKIPIVGPGDRPEPDAYLLLAWNYLSGVVRRERDFLDRGGRFIVPIPYPVVI